MLRRSTRIQLILFVVITLVGVSYVSANYVGLTKGWFGSKGCTIHADFPDSGGIFTNAEVTYRGVTIGRVGTLHLTDSGVRVDLDIDNCSSPQIPVDTSAQVSNRSVIGEQYVNLVPSTASGPVLTGGDVLPADHNTIPIPTQDLLLNLDRLVTSVDPTTLRTTVEELGLALNGRGDDLARLLDSSRALLSTAQQNLNVTLALIQSAAPVLATQLKESGALASFAHSLNLLSGQLKSSDPDIRNLIDNGPSELSVVSNFVKDNRTDIGIVLANLATTNQLLVRHINGVEEVLELYPALAAGSTTVEHPNGTGYLGFVLNVDDPPDCGTPAQGRQGYGGTPVRNPDDKSPQAPNTAAHCNASPNSGVNVRGSQNVPGGDPMYTGGGNQAYPSVVGTDAVRIGPLSTPSTGLSDSSWITVLTGGLY
jgi:phospholipid/cholesterol/gamma-HCH transport system substrate-binding protein